MFQTTNQMLLDLPCCWIWKMIQGGFLPKRLLHYRGVQEISKHILPSVEKSIHWPECSWNVGSFHVSRVFCCWKSRIDWCENLQSKQWFLHAFARRCRGWSQFSHHRGYVWKSGMPHFQRHFNRDVEPLGFGSTLFSARPQICDWWNKRFHPYLVVSWVIGVPPNHHPLQWDVPLQTIHFGVPPF